MITTRAVLGKPAMFFSHTFSASRFFVLMHIVVPKPLHTFGRHAFNKLAAKPPR
jgi:hypothetical protein